MRSFLLVALASAALPLSAGSLSAQGDAKPAPRATERQAPAARSDGGGRGDYAVPRSQPAPARVDAPRAVQSADSGRVRSVSGDNQARERTAPPPDRRGSGSGDRAVPRGSGSGGGSPRSGSGVQDNYTATPRSTERNRGDRQSFGTAVARTRPPYPPHGGYYPGWGWGSSSWYYPYVPLSYGFFWDPWAWGYGYPYYGYPYPWAGYGYGYGYGYGGGSSGSGGSYTVSTSSYNNTYQGPSSEAYGGLRLKVKPKSAQVYVDGQIAGVVDDFDSAFQQLKLDAGPHRIELRHRGFESVSFDIRTEVDKKTTYKAEMKPVP